MNTFSPLTTGLPWPPYSLLGMNSLSQTFFSPSVGKASAIGLVSCETPLRSGPRHWFQSPAQAAEANSKTWAAAKAFFMSSRKRHRTSSSFTGHHSCLQRQSELALYGVADIVARQRIGGLGRKVFVSHVGSWGGIKCSENFEPFVQNFSSLDMADSQPLDLKW
ncbi:hypothetical protein ACFQDI_08560 [Prosthecobacter fluviatilis]|uniref:Uncharacterized protein n=1 Tax=Prosthecobacter fluviatilis TaxID=445931 RepID=A0ABW0KNS4_9BACT